MDRAHYRRITPSRISTEPESGYDGEPRAAAKPSNSIGEKIITQCIVCGILLAAVMAMNLIDVPFTRTVNQSVLSWIRSQTSEEDIRQAWVKTTDFFDGILKTAPSLTSGSSKIESPMLASSLEELEDPPLSAEKDFRIDEDILQFIENGGE